MKNKLGTKLMIFGLSMSILGTISYAENDPQPVMLYYNITNQTSEEMYIGYSAGGSYNVTFAIGTSDGNTYGSAADNGKGPVAIPAGQVGSFSAMIGSTDFQGVNDCSAETNPVSFIDQLWVGENNTNSSNVVGYIDVRNASLDSPSGTEIYGGASMQYNSAFTFPLGSTVTVTPYGNVNDVTGELRNNNFYITASLTNV